jgi:Zn-dependent oligopeptidase
LDEQTKEDGLRWDHTPKELEKLGHELAQEFNATVNNLVGTKVTRTFENTMIPIDIIESDQAYRITALGFYNQVSVSKELRDAATAFEKKLSDFATDLWMREDIYKMIKEYQTNALADGSFKKLDA